MMVDRRKVLQVFTSLETASGYLKRLAVSRARIVSLYPASLRLAAKDGPKFNPDKHHAFAFLTAVEGEPCPCCGRKIDRFEG